MTHCIFCQIIAGQAEASIVYQDEVCIAFMDIQPVNPGHLLVVPKRHAAFLADLPSESGAWLFRVGQQLAAALRSSGLPCEGINFFLADREAAGQEVFHVHLHVIPRYPGDGFGFVFAPDYSIKPGRSELDGNADRIRRALSSL